MKVNYNLYQVWRSYAQKAKLLMVLMTVLFINLNNSRAQTISLITNPDTQIQQQLNSSNCIEYNGNFYFRYVDLSNKGRLAKFNGTSISLIANPDAGTGYTDSPILYAGNLYFSYTDVSGKRRLAKYDGSSITLILNPDGGFGHSGSPIVQGSNLYFVYSDTNPKNVLAKFDGTSITLPASNPDAGSGIVGSPIVYGTDVYYRYRNASNKFSLYKFNGSSASLVTSPDAGNYDGNPIVYGSNLYVQYIDASNAYRLGKYDGTSLTLIPSPDAGIVNTGYAIVYAGNLYFSYQDATNTNRMAQFNGTNINLLTNPDASTTAYVGRPVLMGGNLYYFYSPNIGMRLGKFDGTTMSLPVANPDAGSGLLIDNMVVVGSTIYFRYSDANSKQRLASFDGTNINLINNANTTQPGVTNVLYYAATNQVMVGYQTVQSNFIPFYTPGEYCLGQITLCSRPSLSISSQNNVFCYGEASGSATLNAVGTPPISYLWSQGSTTNSAGSLTAGTYSCVATNSCGADTQLVTISQSPAITQSQSFVLCAGQSVTVGSHTYSTNGVFSDTLTAINGCDSTVTTTVNITVLQPFSTQPSNLTVTSGANASFGGFTSTLSPDYQWQTNAANLGWMNINNNSTYSGANSNNLLITNVGISNHMQKFRLIQNVGACADTSHIAQLNIGDTCINSITDTINITINDTNFVTITDTSFITITDTNLVSISVTDTLIINAVLTGLPAPGNINTILVYPNPTPDMLQINTGDYALMNGYTITITNSLAQVVFSTAINQQLYTIDIGTWTGPGSYILTIKDSTNTIISTKTIIVQ